MGGTAILGDNLIDDLVPDIDDLKAELYADFGTRAFNVQTVKRTWWKEINGDGGYEDEVNTLSPPPEVQKWDGYHWVMLAAGTHEDGQIRLTDVSLTYTFEELTGGQLEENQQFFYRLTDAHGQGQAERILRPNRPPQVDRVKDMCWNVWLMDMNIPEGAKVESEP